MTLLTQKLSKRLTSLSPTTSPETIQTLANWLSFNRHHASSFVSTFLRVIRSPPSSSSSSSPQRQLLYLTVIHQCLILNCPAFQQQADPEATELQWNRTKEFRNSLGDVALEAISGVVREGNNGDVVDRVREMVEEWSEGEVFEGVSLILEARAILEKMKMEEEEDVVMAAAEEDIDDVYVDVVGETTAAAAADHDKRNDGNDENTEIGKTSTAEKDDTEIKKDEVKHDTGTMEMEVEEDKVNAKEETTATTTTTTTTAEQDVSVDNQRPPRIGSEKEKDEEKDVVPTASTLDDKPFDFESQNIPAGTISSLEFATPCKSIATLQITREIHSDVTHRLYSLLQSIPPHIESAARAVIASGESFFSPASSSSSSLLPIPDGLADLSPELLEINIAEASNEVKQYRDVVLKQRQAREKCLELLIKSRCRFGSEVAAREFMGLEKSLELLKVKKVMVADAMELEGWDVEKEVDDGGREGYVEELEPLEWFDAGEKRRRTTPS